MAIKLPTIPRGPTLRPPEPPRPPELAPPIEPVERKPFVWRGPAVTDLVDKLTAEFATNREAVLTRIRNIGPRAATEDTFEWLNAPRIFSAEDALSQFDIRLDEGWQFKVEKTGGLSALTPEGWEIFEAGIVKSPEGKFYTREQIAAMEQPPETPEPELPEVPPEDQGFIGPPTPEEFQFIGPPVPPEIARRNEQETVLRLRQQFGAVFPDQDVRNLLQVAELDPQGFAENLRRAGRTPESEALLKTLFPTITAEEIEALYQPQMLGLVPVSTAQMLEATTSADPAAEWRRRQAQGWVQQEGQWYEPLSDRIKRAIKDVWGDAPGFESWVQNYPGEFIKAVRTGDRNQDKENLLQLLGYTPADIEEVFSVKRVMVTEGRYSAYVNVGPDGSAVDDTGAVAGSLNPVTEKFTRAPKENWFKDAWDQARLTFVTLGHETSQLFTRTLPEVLFRDTDYEYTDPKTGQTVTMSFNGIYDTTTARNYFRHVSASQDRWLEDWIAKHPEFQPRPEYQAGVLSNPKLLADPGYWAYEFATVAPFAIATIGATIAGAMATGNPFGGILTGMAVATPSQVTQMRDALLDAGIPESQVDLMALLSGTLISSVEVAGDLPILKNIAPTLFKRTRTEIEKQVAKGLGESLAKKAGRTFTTIELVETAEEVVQQAIQNAFVKIYDRDRSLFEGLAETAVRTAVGTAPLAALGMAANPDVRARVAKDMERVLPKVGKTLQDTRGFIALPMPEDVEGAAAKKEPWQMTIAEVNSTGYIAHDSATGKDFVQPSKTPGIDNAGAHERAVAKAVFQGKPVPSEVLKDYPDLAKQALAEPRAVEPAVPAKVLTEIGQPIRGRTGFRYRAFDKPNDALGVDVSSGATPFGFGGPYEIEVKSRGGLSLGPGHPGEVRGAIRAEDVTRVFYNPREWAAEVRQAKMAEDLPKLKTIFPQAEFVEVRLADDAETRIAQSVSTVPAGQPLLEEGAVPPAPPKPPPPQSIVPPQPAGPIPPEAARIINQSAEQVRQDRPGGLTRMVLKVPLLRQLMTFERPGFQMTGENEKVLVALVAENAARSDVSTRALSTRLNLLKRSIEVFGKEALRGGKVQGVPFLGTPEQARSILTGTIKDIADNPQLYELTAPQSAVLAEMEARNNELLTWVVDKYGAEIGQWVPKEGGAFLPNVDIGEDVIEYLESETRAVATGRAKTRIWPTARDRMEGKTTFKPELDVQKLIEGLDSFKSSAAGGQTFRAALGGKTRLEAMETTHPDLFKQMMELRKKLISLQGSVGTLEANIAQAITDFLASANEDVDLGNLRDSLEVKLKTGIRAGMDMAALQAEIAAVRADIAALRPAWKAANLKPFVFVQEGVFRYFPSEQAKLVKETRKHSNNPVLNFIERWRGQAFSGDLSPFAIQGTLGVLADPFGSLQAFGGGVRTAIQKHDLLRSVKISALADDIANNLTEWAEYASLMGRQLSGTPAEYAAGFLSKLPGFDKFTESTYITVTRGSFNLWQRSYQHMVKSGVPEIEAKVAAAKMASEVYPLVNTTRLGQSQARASVMRALPTSYSFIRQPVSLLAEASKGYAKLLTFQKLTPSESLSMKLATMGAASTLVVSATSAALSAMAKGGDADDIKKAIWDAINPNPYNGNFAAIIIGNKRIPLGGPFRAIFRAVWPQEVPGVPFPVPMVGVPNYVRNRITPALSTQLDLIVNKDYSNTTILKGNLPERILRLLEYEFEGFLPLSAGAAVEALRRGDRYYEPIWQQVIGQFMGVNMITLDNTYLERQIRKLGTQVGVIAKPFEVNKPDIYSSKDLWTDAGRVLAFRKEQSGKETGYDDPPIIKLIMEARAIKAEMETYPNVSVVTLYDRWLEGDPNGETDFDVEYEKKYGKKLSSDIGALLREYDRLEEGQLPSLGDAQKAFLKEHLELKVNPQDAWLKAHPEENAKLAVWGQAKVVTREAYDRAMALLKELDMPDSVVSEDMPPKELVDAWFKYSDVAEQWGGSDPEAKLLRVQDRELSTWLEKNKGLAPIKTPIKVLEIKVKNRDLDAKYRDFSNEKSDSFLPSIPNKDDPNYAKGREFAIEQFEKDNPVWVDDQKRIEAYNHNADDTTAEVWVERGKKAAEFGGGSAEVKLFFADNRQIHQWALKEKLVTDDGKDWNIPALRLQAKNRIPSDKYKSLTSDAAKDAFEAQNTAWADDMKRIRAYGYFGAKIDTATAIEFMWSQPGNKTDYGVVVAALQGKADKQAAIETLKKRLEADESQVADIEKAAVASGLLPLEVPEYKALIKANERKRSVMTLLIGAGSPEQLVETYVGYYKLMDAASKLNDEKEAQFGANDAAYARLTTDKLKDAYLKTNSAYKAERIRRSQGNYEDDWFKQANPGFYKAMVNAGVWKETDFSKVPTRAVFASYGRYLAKPEGEARTNARKADWALDVWLVIAKGYKGVTAQGKAAETTGVAGPSGAPAGVPSSVTGFISGMK